MKNLKLKTQRFLALFSVSVLFLFLYLYLFPSPAHALVTSFSNNSTCASISPPPGPIYEGYKYTAIVTMTNIGDNSWSTATGYALGAVGNTLNWGANRALSGSTVVTNQTATFTFTFDITVNASPGTYSFSWQMVRDPEGTYGFFGATCSASITVLPSPYALYLPLLLKNHPAGYTPTGGKSTENSPYYTASSASEKQWSYAVVQNPDTANAVDVNVTIYDYQGTARSGGAVLASYKKNIPAGGLWNSFGDTGTGEWSAWTQSWVNHDRTGTADDSVLGWAKVVPVAASVGSAPIPVFGQQRVIISEPATASGNPAAGAIHLLTDMALTSSASATLYGGYFMRNWPAGYPNDSAVIQNTYMNIANPNSSSANVALKIYKTDGTLHYTLNKTINAFGSWYAYGDPTGSGGWNDIPLIDTTNSKSLGWVEITSDKPVTGFNRTAALKPSGDFYLLTDFPLAPPSSSVNLYTPLYVKNHSSGFTSPITSSEVNQWSYLTLHNPGSSAATASIQAYSKTRTAGTPFSKVIPAHATWFAKNDTNWNDVGVGTVGWVEVTSDVPLVGINRVSIGGESGTSHHYWTDYAMDFLGSRALYSAYYLNGHSSGYWESGGCPGTSAVCQKSYLQIANPGNSSAVVTIKVRKPDGTGITGLTYGWVELSSTQPIVAINRITFAKTGAGTTNWLRIMTDAPLAQPPPASLGVLNVVPDTATLAVQGPAYGRTGLRIAESGSNFYNAIQVTQKAQNATTSNVSLVGSAFAAAPPVGGKAYIHSIEGDDPLGILKTRADSTSGFILIYAANNTTQGSGPTPGTSAGQSGCATYNFCASKYYAYKGATAGGSWLVPVGFVTAAGDVGDEFGTSGTGAVIVPRTSTKPEAGPNFSTTLYTSIGNKSWTTYGYLMNVNGEERSIVQKSCPATVSDPNSPSYTTTCF